MTDTCNLMITQVHNEFYNAQLYRSIGIAFDLMGFEGFATLYYDHAQEETGHGMKFLHYLADRGEKVVLKAIEAPPSFVGKTALEMAQATYDAEVKTTKAISAIADQAAKDRDHMSYAELQWFLQEQVSEENEASKLVGQLTMCPETALITLNAELLEE